MTKYRGILRLKSQGHSQQSIVGIYNVFKKIGQNAWRTVVQMADNHSCMPSSAIIKLESLSWLRNASAIVVRRISISLSIVFGFIICDYIR